jgi:hypothetical protein
MCPVTVLKYVKHTRNYVKAELARDKTIYLKLSSVSSAVFDGQDCSLVLHVGQRVYCLPNMTVEAATEIVSFSVKGER